MRNDKSNHICTLFHKYNNQQIKAAQHFKDGGTPKYSILSGKIRDLAYLFRRDL